jgi:hypothetical protein
MRKLLMSLVAIATSAAGFPTLAQEPAPLPEPGPFLENVRKHLKSDRSLMSQYTCLERETERRLNDKGTITKEETRLSEIYPGIDDADDLYRRTIVINGKPVSAAELDKKDGERRKKVVEAAERRARENEAERVKRLERDRQRERREQETIDEVMKVYDVRLLARETIDGRPAIMCSVSPRPAYAPKTRNGKILKKLGGRVWVDERDYELVRADLEALEDLTFGLGLFARLHKGSHLEIARRKVNGEIWLPAEIRYQISARIALLKRIRAEGQWTYSDYKKFSVSTSTTFGIPK